MTLEQKIAAAVWLGASVLRATCHPSMTGQAAGAIFSLNLMRKSSLTSCPCPAVDYISRLQVFVVGKGTGFCRRL